MRIDVEWFIMFLIIFVNLEINMFIVLNVWFFINLDWWLVYDFWEFLRL